MTCPWCEEPIGEGEKHFLVSHLTATEGLVSEKRPWHRECWLRQISGSVNHQLRKCSCYGGVEHEDTGGLSKREEARAAVKMWKENHARDTRT